MMSYQFLSEFRSGVVIFENLSVSVVSEATQLVTSHSYGRMVFGEMSVAVVETGWDWEGTSSNYKKACLWCHLIYMFNCSWLYFMLCRK